MTITAYLSTYKKMQLQSKKVFAQKIRLFKADIKKGTYLKN